METPEQDPDDDAGIDVSGGVDTNADGLADTVLTDDGFDLVVAVDDDGDGIADQVLRIGPDAEIREAEPSAPDSALGDLFDWLTPGDG